MHAGKYSIYVDQNLVSQNIIRQHLIAFYLCLYLYYSKSKYVFLEVQKLPKKFSQ